MMIFFCLQLNLRFEFLLAKIITLKSKRRPKKRKVYILVFAKKILHVFVWEFTKYVLFRAKEVHD